MKNKLKTIEFKGNMTETFRPGNIRIDWVLEGFARREKDEEMRLFAESASKDIHPTEEELGRFDGGY